MPEGQVKVRCSNCGESFRVAEASLSGSLICPSCRQPLRTRSAKKDEQDPLVGKRVAGYRFLHRLGRGSMGRVYEAESEDGERVAFKLLSNKVSDDEELLERFHREARLSIRLRHPNLIAGYESGQERGAYYLVMERAYGKGLDRVIDRGGPIPWERAADIVRQVAAALVYLAEAGIVHRDIKPENIMVDDRDGVKLLDLGFAKTSGKGTLAEAEVEGLTMVGTSLGSPAYMAPEQVIDAASATEATDVYCLAASFYHALTGRLPYNGKTAMEVMEKVIRQQVVPPHEVESGVPLGVSAFVVWAMEKDPGKRPANAAAFIEELDATVDRPEDAARVAGAAKAGRGGGRKWPWIVLLVLVLAAAAFAALHFTGRLRLDELI